MKIITRSGSVENLDLNKITNRIKKAIEYCGNLDPCIDADIVSIKVVNSIHEGISTSELDEITARICMNLSLEHPDWGILGSGIIISNHQKNTKWTFSEAMTYLWNNVNKKGEHCPLINETLYNLVKNNAKALDESIFPERDFYIDYFGFQTLKRSYLLKTEDKIIRETPQYMFMRVALGIWSEHNNAIKTYNMLSTKLATHATPTLFNSGTNRPSLSSCFLLGTEDSIDGIYKTITDCAKISKCAGGIGIHVSNIRAKDSYIKGSGGYTSGLIPMMKVYNATARYVDQSNKRKGSFALYLEPWHADIILFLKSMRNHGSEEELARDLFYALWIPDVFMTAVKNDNYWYLMCPDECSGLTDVYGEEFSKLYYEYVNKKIYRKKVKAREIWGEVIKSQIESGMPYISYKDHVNRKSNQMNIGIIKSSNLCNEIVLYSDNKEYAVCNLASICLPEYLKYTDRSQNEIELYTIPNCNWCKILKIFLKHNNINYTENYFDSDEKMNDFKEKNCVKTFPQLFIDGKRVGGFDDSIELLRPQIDYNKLRQTVHTLVENLNEVIDINYYPVPEAEYSNKKHRPIGIGVQGLADLFVKLWTPFTSQFAREINRNIFEAMYFFALEKSCIIAKEKGPYETFKGSPLSKGQFQFNLWGFEDTSNWNWEKLREQIMENGVRNSVLIALMPTASTSQIMGNTESFEPYTSNMYVRRTLSGEFIILNKFLIRILCDLGIWNQEMKYRIMYNRGSIQKIRSIPAYVKDMFKTIWEISNKTLIDMSADRGRFIDQTQSLNHYMEDSSPENLTKLHLYAWKQGLKTGSYYLRTKPAVNSQSFTISPIMEEMFKQEHREHEKEECLNCSS